MKNLQNNYNAWTGDFKSFDEGDILVFRDRITSIELKEDKLTFRPYTMLYFSAYLMPTIDDLRVGRCETNSWYSWRTYDTQGVTAGCSSIFVNKRGSSAVFENYLPEVGIGVSGDVTGQFRIGNIIECKLSIMEGIMNNPNARNSRVTTEGITQFSLFNTNPVKVG